MRIYWEYIKNSFKELLAYRVDYFAGIIQTLLSFLVQLFLWQALMRQTGQASTSASVVTLKDMITYVFASAVISSLARSSLIYDINDRVRNGQISADLVRPMDFMAYMFCRLVGRSLFNFFFQFLPVLAVGLIFLDLNVPTIPNLLLFCVAVINALIILFLMTFSLGMMAFWYMSMWQVDILLGTAFELLAGGWIPLWFSPAALATAASFLPFRLVYFVPISIYLGKLGGSEVWFAVVQQVVWIGVLFLVSRLVWRAGVRKLVIQGG